VQELDLGGYMMEFKLDEYKSKDTNTKRKVFFEFLYELFGLSKDCGEFDNENFILLNEDDLMDSLRYYISKNSVTAQGTAKNYITYIEQFFVMLSDEYNIKNEIFINKDLYNKFIARTKEITSKLKTTENKGSASDKQYEELNNGIDDFLKNISEHDIYDEINKLYEREMKHAKNYHRFVSVIPIKLIMKFALSNLTVISLEINALDMENHILDIKDGIKLPLDEELIQLFEVYLRIRKYVLNLSHKQDENKLFVKYNGESYITSNDNKDYSSFFMIMSDYINTQSADLFATRTILNMLDKGLDIYTISKVVGIPDKKCMKLQENSNKDDDINIKLQSYFTNALLPVEKKVVKKKGYFDCPFCGKSVKAISDDWVLVQFENGDTKYLACKECRGQNEKISI
jgi:hypothetical protein